MLESPVSIALAFVAAINAGDVRALRALMAEDHTFTDALGNSFQGAEQMAHGWTQFFHHYPQYRIKIDRTFAEGSQAALFGEAHGKWRVEQRILSQTWSVPAAWLAGVEGGAVKSWRVFCDTGWANPPEDACEAKA